MWPRDGEPPPILGILDLEIDKQPPIRPLKLRDDERPLTSGSSSCLQIHLTLGAQPAYPRHVASSRWCCRHRRLQLGSGIEEQPGRAQSKGRHTGWNGLREKRAGEGE